MNKEKRERLERRGWKIGNPSAFLKEATVLQRSAMIYLNIAMTVAGLAWFVMMLGLWLDCEYCLTLALVLVGWAIGSATSSAWYWYKSMKKFD